MEKTVRYARMGEVVVLIFPDESGSKHFITQIETQSLLKKIGLENVPVKTVDQRLKPRFVV